MARVSPVVNEIITKLSQDLAQAGFGEKGALIDKACADTQLSRATVCRLVKELSVPTSRKQRCDAGTSALTIEEAKEISALLMVGVRGNDKRIVTIENALDDLRANKRIKAERIDATTGEIKRLSNSAIVRALRAYGYHPEQLKQVAPVVALASKHPNHVWQIDASISTLYYMEDDGLEQTDKAVHYKNKPENMEKIAKKRLWRYVVTDHTSGAFYLEYVLGAESGENLTHCFMNAMIQRGKHGMFGAPLMVMLDPGSANTGAMFKNLCKALDVTVQINKPGNPRAKGQVEKTHDIVEVQFEGKFRLQRPKSLQEINERAAQWSVFFNGNKTHSRHGMTRFAAWSKITPAQLRIVPSLAVLRELAVLAPKECKVNQYLEVSYKGKDYSVKGIVPNVRVGEKLLVTMNPYRSDVAQVIDRDANGNEVYYLVPEVVQLEFGFREDAAMIGEQYKAIAHTPAQTALAEVEAVAKLTLTGKKRDNKQVAFAGEIDPYKHMEQTPTPAYLPKAGTALEVKTTKVVYDLLPVFEAAFKHIKPRLEAAGIAWTAEHLQWLQQRFAAGIENDEAVFDGIVQTMKGTKAVPLKAVGGVK